MKILVIRNDKLGDFVQAFPAFAMLKASNPERSEERRVGKEC